MQQWKEEPQKYPEPTTGAIIVAPTMQMLLVRSLKWGDKWTIPGGHIELGEKSEEAVVREIKEETGLDVTPVELLIVQEAIFSPEFHRRKHFLFIDYLCATRNPRVNLDKVELQEHRWFTPQDALNLNLTTFVRNIINRYIEWLKEPRADNASKLLKALEEDET